MLSRDLRNIAATLHQQGEQLGFEKPAVDLTLLAVRLDAIAAGIEAMEALTVPMHLRGFIPAERIGDSVVPLRRPAPKGEQR